jgi:hypothetical protein
MTAITKCFERFTEAGMGDEVLLMRNDNGEFFSLPQTAATIWRLIDGERDRAALVAAAAREHGVADADIQADVDEFLAELRELGLIADG